MKFTSTRNRRTPVDFSHAILDCMPEDGGLYAPSEPEDLRKWILHINENTPFKSIAGTLTSAFINDEFSPIISETIATRAFDFAPDLRRLDDNLFLLDLTTGPTGRQRDFGSFYLASIVETVLQLQGGAAVFLDVTTGELGASLALALRGKKNVKAALIYPKGAVRGLQESDYVWNGGNILPLEVDGTADDCYRLMREAFADRRFIAERCITVANTANIGRLMPQAFLYTFAFSRIKNDVCGDIFYALSSENYSEVVAGLYSWQFALPVNGFILPSTDALAADTLGNPVLLDSIVPIAERIPSDPSSPSNLERLEEVFSANPLMMRHFVYPVDITEDAAISAAKELFVKYQVYADLPVVRAYASYKTYAAAHPYADAATILISRDHPSISADFLRRTVGETPPMPDRIRASLTPTRLNRPLIKTIAELKQMIEENTPNSE
ncbi:MAG: threonine synthase [Treponema sp.]